MLGPAATQAGFPVTHYVGVAGVGPDAGRLPADDPRAGVFGYGRTTRPADITRGTANVIAVLGVSEHCGAWAAGGEATVRPLTQRPYVNGPDGFGSGQPGGMLAGMADGSVRFISKDVDPGVLEQLATIHGNDGVTVAALGTEAGAGRRPAQGPAIGPGEARRHADDEPAGPRRQDKPAAPAAAARRQRRAPPGRQDPRASSFPTRRWATRSTRCRHRATLPIAIDPDALVAAGVSLRDPVSVRLADATVGEDPGNDPRRPQARLRCRRRPAAGHHAGGISRNAPPGCAIRSPT